MTIKQTIVVKFSGHAWSISFVKTKATLFETFTCYKTVDIFLPEEL